MESASRVRYTYQDLIEVRRPGADEAERVADVLAWRVGERRLEIRLEEVFRGVGGRGG